MPDGKGSMAPTTKPKSRDGIPVSMMSPPEKGEAAIRKAIDRLPGDMRTMLNQMVSPEALALMIAAAGVTLGAWAISHYFGIGFVLDLIFAIGFIGSLATAWSIASELYDAGTILQSAQTEGDLDRAAVHLSNAMVLIGPELFFMLLGGAAKVAGKSARALSAMATKAGMLDRHARSFHQVARELNVVIVVRNTNAKCLQWIERGFPGKPRWFQSIKTTKPDGTTTGIATARLNHPGDLLDIENARKMGHYAVDADGVARGMKGEVLNLAGADWPVEPGQIIDRVTRKPYVGDYDLLDVIEPGKLSSHGALESQYYGMGISNITNKLVTETLRRLNQYMGEQRVMHSAWAQYDDVGLAGDCTAFFPDGTMQSYKASELRELFLQWGRPIMSH